ncbi:MAG: hypothetical protein HW380_3445 [Magnetococcales bacterium]|nr:hypothetical protein [Magnetococcales bacterium]
MALLPAMALAIPPASTAEPLSLIPAGASKMALTMREAVPVLVEKAVFVPLVDGSAVLAVLLVAAVPVV